MRGIDSGFIEISLVGIMTGTKKIRNFGLGLVWHPARRRSSSSSTPSAAATATAAATVAIDTAIATSFGKILQRLHAMISRSCIPKTRQDGTHSSHRTCSLGRISFLGPKPTQFLAVGIAIAFALRLHWVEKSAHG